MMRYKFASESLADQKAQCSLILADDDLTESEKKRLINDIRLSVMGEYKYYSKKMSDLDNFIRTERERLRWEKQRTARLQRQKAR